MSYQVLARKYRPQKFSEVIGQEHVTRTLKNAIEQERIAHGYIFSGHRGIGKTTVARILAMALNCRSSDKPVAEPCGVCDSCTEIRAGNAVDVIEIDAATNRGIDEIRELREAARYRPARDRFKIYILDEAHQITDAAFNALLKTLEEPPGHVIFMLATTQPEDIPQTIRSRCQHFSFRAVKFEQIVEQLKDLCGRENIQADEDALALLAEAGDGSMRDALSILDQAIASSQGQLSADAVRQLIGVAPSGILEEIMQAVARSSSEEILQSVDRLLAEGQNPVHFARQLVRFLRNATVAKVAGPDSSLLQISSDERARVGRVAELFSEEELTRHLQIMLRTHSELGYRQEQRFHLELGLLKLAHVQRLLPLEQLLSGVEANRPAAPERKLTLAPEPRKADPATPSRTFVSPFAADSARKGTPRSEFADQNNPAPSRPVSAATNSAPVVMGSAAPAVASSVPAMNSEPQKADVEQARAAVLTALSKAGQSILCSMLDGGEWKLEGNGLIISITASATLIEMSVSADARRLMIAAASGVLGRAIRLQIVPGANSTTMPQKATTSYANGSSRARAEEEPVVRRMKEKFGAEIRTVIDYRKDK
ncbi:MAG TPA: DNA polymerase III subunit gamma/tau [Terriglobales bacterium]|nr:DNA polymerase III subunit gamma/tau [Terriglobales bacterium]